MKLRTCGLVCFLAGCGITHAAGIASSGTNGEDAVKLRAEFLEQALPISYEPHVKTGDRFHLSWVELSGRTRSFASRHTLHELIYAFWPWLDDPEHAPEATILLLGVTHREMMRPHRLSYVDRSHPGNWAALAPGYVDECKIECRAALNQPEWWYPHPMLFDRDRVLAESKANAAARAAYIGAMVKALADPKIRTENPLEVRNILGVLSALNATEASATFVQYAFFDWQTGRDFRRRSGSTNDFADVHGLILPIATLIPRLGTRAFPLVIERLSSATTEEMSVQQGGGAFPVLAVMYFIGSRCSEREALEAIDAFVRAKRELSNSQLEALRVIRDAVHAKRYRPAWLDKVSTRSYRDWAAPVATNSPFRE